MCNRSLLCAIFCGLWLTQCGPTPVGNSVGRPTIQTRSSTSLRVQITQLSFSNTGASITLEPNQTVAPQDQNLHLLTAYEDLDLSGNANVTLQAGQPVQVSLAALSSLHTSAGEVLLTDASANPVGYLAWGNDPNNFDTGLSGMAQNANVVTAGYIPVPLGNPNDLPLVLNSNSTTPCQTGDPAAACGTTPNLAVQIVSVTPYLGRDANSFVGSTLGLQNNTAAAVDIYGLMLCRNGQCTMLDPATANNPNAILPPNSVTLFDVGQGNPNALGLPAAGSGPVYPPYLTPNEELVLLPPGPVPDPNGPNTVLWSYVRTSSSAPMGFATLAHQQKLWGNPSDPNEVAPAPTQPGQSLVFGNPNVVGVSATSWSLSPAN